MSRNNIELSPEHGVNPTIPVCFWCGKEKNEIALLGRIRERDSNGRAKRGSDVQAPMKMVLDYFPCDTCESMFEQGVQCIEVSKSRPDARPPIQGNLYPTGRFTVITVDAANHVFSIHGPYENGGKILLDTEVFHDVFASAIGQD